VLPLNSGNLGLEIRLMNHRTVVASIWILEQASPEVFVGFVTFGPVFGSVRTRSPDDRTWALTRQTSVLDAGDNAL